MNSYNHFKQLIAQQAGSKFFSVEFTKKDGSLRRMTVQLPAAMKYGGKNSEAAAKRKLSHPNLWNVYDAQKNGIRTVNLDTVIRVRINGRIFTPEGVRQHGA